MPPAKLKTLNLSFDVAFTSDLKRAQNSLALIFDELRQTKIPIFANTALNERDYGDLSGLNKDDACKRWGEEQVQVWRRSYDVAPPGGESLKDTLARALPYYVTEILPGVPPPRAHFGRGSWQFAARTRDGTGSIVATRDRQA